MTIPNDKIKIKVENGWVSLEGELEWNYQREAARSVTSRLTSVRGVTNNITISSETADTLEQKDIEHALARNWSLNDRNVHVKVTGTKVTLTGIVNSAYQKDSASQIAWNAPGVKFVDNQLKVEYDYALID
jgi:osmotically-inducible protein OsmY